MNPQSPTPVPPALLVPDKPREITDQPLHDHVVERAKKLWNDYGQPAGRDDEIWIEAEKQILSEACHGQAKN